jgi:hypothetical protein
MTQLIAYIKKDTLEYPRYEGDIRLEHPEIGEVFELPETYEPVYLQDPEGSAPRGMRYVEDTPTSIDGTWYTTWKLEKTIQFVPVTINNRTEQRIPQKETLWFNGELYRESIAVCTDTGSAILNDLKTRFPEEEAGVSPIELIGYSPAKRPPYTNESISWYTWKLPSDSVVQKYSVTETALMPWYGKKYNLVDNSVLLKITHREDIAKPAGAPTGPEYFYGEIYYENGSKDDTIDYYVVCDSELIRQFCTDYNITFPIPEEFVPTVMGWSIVYKRDILDVLMVKAYVMTPVSIID